MKGSSKRRGALPALLSVAAVLAAAATARADGPFEGQWREGALQIQVQVESWGGDCGPRPRSTSAPGGRTFNITQSGDQLTFERRPRRTTRSCWSDNRAVRRVSSTYQAGTWRIVCRTPSADSRSETGTYTIRSSGERLLRFRDVSRYDWQLNESRCLATITTTQSFSRIGGQTTASAPPTKAPERPNRCQPGEPVRLALRPASTEVNLDSRVCFTARTMDASGCSRRTAVTLSVEEGDGRIEGACLETGASPGTVRVRARTASLQAEATVTVRALDLSDLIARRIEGGQPGAGQDATPEAETDARLSARAQRDESDLTWPLVGLAAALALIMLALLGLRRQRRPRATAGSENSASEEEASFTAVSEAHDASDASASPNVATVTPPLRVCPTCRRGFSDGSERCPQDDTPLVPYSEFASGGSDSGPRGVCPVCGADYGPQVTFCGKDGAALEIPTG